MAKYQLHGGGEIEFNNPLIGVKKLRSMQFIRPTGEDTDEIFMKNTAERCEAYDASVIETSSHKAFIESLIDSGFLIPIEEEEEEAGQ